MTAIMLAIELGPSPAVELIAALLSDWRVQAGFIFAETATVIAVRWAWRVWRRLSERRAERKRQDRGP
jgi:hypothetical protein